MIFNFPFCPHMRTIVNSRQLMCHCDICLNMFPSTSLVVTSPTISERWKRHSHRSCEMKSPDAVATANIRRLVERLLQPLRDRLGEPIAILSGYRSDELNRLVGGVPSSQHRLGEAADCYCAAGPDHLLKVLKASGLPFDQAIIYCRRQFLHLSYREGRNRGMVIYK